MKPFDDHNDLTTKSVPEIIRELWALYMDMSGDPALAPSACHIRSAVLALESTRRLALQVYLEAQQAAVGKPAKKARRTSRNGRNNNDKDQAALDWLRTARVASPWKN